jgi:hypothetical protein
VQRAARLSPLTAERTAPGRQSASGRAGAQASQTASTITSKNVLRRAERLLRAGEYEQALGPLVEGAPLFPRNPALYGRGLRGMTRDRAGGFFAEGVMSRPLAIAPTATETPRFSTTASTPSYPLHEPRSRRFTSADASRVHGSPVDAPPITLPREAAPRCVRGAMRAHLRGVELA